MTTAPPPTSSYPPPGYPPHPSNPSPVTPPPRRGRRLLAVVVELVDRVLRQPVIEGRLRTTGWPPGLRTVLVVSLIAAVGCTISMVAAPALRANLPLGAAPSGTTLPEPLVWIAAMVSMFALALLQAGALHTRWWVRIVALLTTLSTYSSLASTTTVNDSAGLTLVWVLGAWLSLVVLNLIRLRRSYAWWEFAWVLLVNTAVLVLTLAPRLQARSVVLPGELVATAQESLVYVGVLAVPVAIAAGFAIAQLVLSTVVWSMDLARRHLPSRALPTLLVVVAGWRFAAELSNGLANRSVAAGRILDSVALLAAGLLVWLVIDQLADRAERRASRRAPDKAAVVTGDTGILHLGERLVRATMPVGVVISIAGLVTFLSVPTLYGVGLAERYDHARLAQVLTLTNQLPTLVGNALATDTGRVAVSAALLAVGLAIGSRGARGIAELVALVAVIRIATVVSSEEQVLTMLPLVVTVVLLALLIIWAAGRRLTPVRIEGLLVGLLVCAAFGSRQLFADPFELLIGGTAAVVIGLVWGFLTGGADANGDSRSYPRPARVLLLLGNSTIGFGLLAYAAWARDRVNTLDLVYHQEQGDLLLGGSLLICAMFSVVVAGARNREIGTPQP